MFTKLNRPTALAIGAIALSIAAIGPWISFFGLGGGPSDFLEVGLVVFGGLGLVIISALTGRLMRPVSIFVGVAVLAEVGYVWFALSESDTNPFVTPGWGLYLSIATGLFLIASTWVAKKKA